MTISDTDEDWMDNVASADLLALDLEYKLTIAFRLSSGEDCDCVRYLIYRREVLMREILKSAFKQGKDPVDLFHEYQKKVHARHEED